MIRFRISPQIHRFAAGLAGAALLGAGLTACSSGSTGASAATASTSASSSSQAPAGTTYPLTIENCGTKVTFASAPQRVLSIKSTSTDTLLALGLGSAITGTAFQDSPGAPDYAAAAAKLPVLAAKMPSSEAVLAAKPDFVYSGWESAFAASAAGERATLGGLGTNTYVSPLACRTATAAVTFDKIFADVAEVGQIMNAPKAASDLVAKQRAALAAIKPAGNGRTVVWWSSDSKSPYVGAGTGAPDAIIAATGLKNVFASVGKPWANVSWEELLAADPDVIVIADATWSKAATKREKLLAQPGAANLKAVAANHIVVLPFATTEPGVRNVEAVQTLNAAIAKF